VITLLCSLAFAEERAQTLVWDVTSQGKALGTRTVTVRYLEGEGGTNRVLEGFTDLDGQVGPMKVRWRQRMTANIDAREPASFQSVIETNGTALEVQGRWTPSTWIVTTVANGKSRTVEMPLTRVDVSTADLLDPDSRLPISLLDPARILSAETGEVLSGPVLALGAQDLTIGGQIVPVTSYAWTTSQGRSEFSYSADGFLVRQVSQLLGVTIEAQLRQPPPGGVDDFPVQVGRPAIEVMDL
jgi:hypothetical protein